MMESLECFRNILLRILIQELVDIVNGIALFQKKLKAIAIPDSIVATQIDCFGAYFQCRSDFGDKKFPEYRTA